MSTTLECCAPRRLTTAEREHYDTHGYVVVSGLFTPEEVKAYDDELSRLMREDGVNKQRGERFIHRMELHSKLMDDFMKDPRVLMLLEDIIYPGCRFTPLRCWRRSPTTR